MATLRELADLVGGTAIGDGAAEIRNVAPIEAAGEGDITFVANPKYLSRLASTRASAVIVTPGVDAPGRNLIVCPNPYLAFAKVLTALRVRRPEPRGIMAGASVHPGARIAEGVTIHPGCVVGEGASVGRGTVLHPNVVLYENASVGEDCLIHAGVVVREECRLGDRVIVQPGAVIGSDGFGFAPDGPRYFKIPQVGTVEIEDDVEIGAGACVDRATLGVTRIRRGTKLDNLVQIAHNVEVGEDTILVAQVGIAGSTKIGRHCTFGGQSGTAGHITIGDNVMIGGQSGVHNDLDGGQVLSGTPAIPHKDWLKAAMTFGKLPDMRKELGRLKRLVEEIEMQIKEK